MCKPHSLQLIPKDMRQRDRVQTKTEEKLLPQTLRDHLEEKGD